MVDPETLVPIDRFEVFAEGLDHPEGLGLDVDGNLWAGANLGRSIASISKGTFRTVTTLSVAFFYLVQ